MRAVSFFFFSLIFKKKKKKAVIFAVWQGIKSLLDVRWLCSHLHIFVQFSIMISRTSYLFTKGKIARNIGHVCY